MTKIVVMTPPEPDAIRGSQGRLTMADLEALAGHVKAGARAGDGEHVIKRSTAQQRAKSAAVRVEKHFNVKSQPMVWPDPEGGGYLWAIGPPR